MAHFYPIKTAINVVNMGTIMMRLALYVVTGLVALVGTGCALPTPPPPPNPFKIAQDEFYRQIKTLALAPLGMPREVENPESVRAQFEALITTKLQEAGFSTAPSQPFAEIWQRMADQVGGLFDPHTGQRDKAKFQTAWEYALRELGTTFKVDALVQARIQPVIVPFRAHTPYTSTAIWHGTSEVVGGGGMFGTIDALSLVITIVDPHGVVLYTNAGGIQLLSKLLSNMKGDQFVPVPRQDLFADEERNVAAVKIALGPLIWQRPRS
jgi:hypothetical protein